MKPFKRILIILISAVLSAIFFAACDTDGGGSDGKDGEADITDNADGGDETPETPPAGEGISVKIGTYDTEKGTVSVSAPANGAYYELRESVTVTAAGKEGFELSAICVNGTVRERLSSVYTFLLTEDVTVSAVFASSSDDLPVVTFSSLAVSSFQALFRGHWKSEEGETLYIGEKKLRYHGAAVSSVTPRNSGAEQSYNFELDGTVYSIAWARTDYTVGYVIDILNIRSGEREFFFPDPLPTERVTLDGIYAGDWTCVEEGQTRTLSVENNTVVYNDHTITDIIDGGYYETTNDIFATPIGTNIYFFLQGGQMHILMWNGSLNCPDVDGYVFSGGSEQGDYTFPEALRGVWKSVDGKTAVITETSFTLNGESVSVRGSDAAFIFTAGGKTYEGNLYAGSDDILQISSEIYGNDGLLAGYTYEYYFREGRPAVTLNAVLEGTWTGINGTAGSVSVSGGQIVWNGVSLTVVAAGEERTDGYVYYVAVGGKVYELSVLNTAESDDMPPLWLMTLTGDGETYFFAASET